MEGQLGSTAVWDRSDKKYLRREPQSLEDLKNILNGLHEQYQLLQTLLSKSNAEQTVTILRSNHNTLNLISKIS